MVYLDFQLRDVSACYRKIVTPVDPYRRRSSRPDYGRKLGLNRATVVNSPFLFEAQLGEEGGRDKIGEE